MNTEIYLGLGGNLGDPRPRLRRQDAAGFPDSAIHGTYPLMFLSADQESAASGTALLNSATMGVLLALATVLIVAGSLLLGRARSTRRIGVAGESGEKGTAELPPIPPLKNAAEATPPALEPVHVLDVNDQD